MLACKERFRRDASLLLYNAGKLKNLLLVLLALMIGVASALDDDALLSFRARPRNLEPSQACLDEREEIMSDPAVQEVAAAISEQCGSFTEDVQILDYSPCLEGFRALCEGQLNGQFETHNWRLTCEPAGGFTERLDLQIINSPDCITPACTASDVLELTQQDADGVAQELNNDSANFQNCVAIVTPGGESPPSTAVPTPTPVPTPAATPTSGITLDPTQAATSTPTTSSTTGATSQATTSSPTTGVTSEPTPAATTSGITLDPTQAATSTPTTSSTTGPTSQATTSFPTTGLTSDPTPTATTSPTAMPTQGPSLALTAAPTPISTSTTSTPVSPPTQVQKFGGTFNVAGGEIVLFGDGMGLFGPLDSIAQLAWEDVTKEFFEDFYKQTINIPVDSSEARRRRLLAATVTIEDVTTIIEFQSQDPSEVTTATSEQVTITYDQDITYTVNEGENIVGEDEVTDEQISSVLEAVLSLPFQDEAGRADYISRLSDNDQTDAFQSLDRVEQKAVPAQEVSEELMGPSTSAATSSLRVGVSDTAPMAIFGLLFLCVL